MRDHIFLKHGLAFPVWVPPHICTGAIPPYSNLYLDLTPREKRNFVSLITIMVRELINV